MTMMKGARELLSKLQEKYPEIRAMTFYGSRTLDRERKWSDLDTFIFYDPEKMTDKDTNNSRAVATDLNKFLGDIKEKGVDLTDLEKHWLNISKEFTKSDFEHFKEVPWKGDFGADTRFGSFSSQATMPEGHVAIISRFMPGVGDIYSARKAIFDLLEKEEPEAGEKLFRTIMNRLSRIERPPYTKNHKLSDIPDYSYPKTIAEGKKYFLTHQPD